MSVIEDLTTAFQQVADAHHEAYAAVDGADPDWAIWYAAHLKPRFDELLSAELPESEIVSLLLALAQEHQARGHGDPWPRFYAQLTAERFVAASEETLALYQFSSCPYCHLVRQVIEELDLQIELRDIAEERKWYDELVAARGRATVPVLRCEDPRGAVRWMPESRDIIRYLRRRYG